MTQSWPRVRLGEVLDQVDNAVPTSQLDEIELAGVYSFGRGLFRRGLMSPAETTYKTYNRLVRDDFVISQPKAWEGALARVTAKFDGLFLSPVFPTFRPNRARLEPVYLEWYCRQSAVWAELKQRSKGMGARRESVSPTQFLSLEIPLPPLGEQQRIVARIEALAGQIREAQGLRQETFDDAESLLISMAHRIDLDDTEKQRQGWKKVVLGDVISLASNPYNVAADESYPNFGIYSFAKGLFHKPPIEGAATSATSLYRAKEGQFIYSRLFAFEGSYGYVTEDFAGCYVSNEYPMFDCQPEHVRAEFLSAYFKAPNVWREVAAGSKGLGDRRQRVQPTQVLAYSLWLPPIEWQDRIAAVWGQLNKLNATQIEAAAELDALLPAVLEKAFRGTLTIGTRP